MTAVDGSQARADTARGPTAGDPTSARSLHHTTVVTPEGVVLEFRAAGIGSRTLAIVIDLIVQFIAAVVLLFVVGAASFLIGSTASVVAILVGLFLVFYGYPIGMEAAGGGRTLGKRALGLRVLTIEGGPVGVRHATIRALLGLFDYWLPAPGGLVALAFALTTTNSQRLGDLAAGTIVVREARAASESVLFAPAPGAEGFGLNLDASRLQPAHYALAREFLVRAPDLLPDARAQLSLQLADSLAEATGTVRPPELHPEWFVQSLLFAYQRRSAALDADWGPARRPPSGHPVGSPPPGGPPIAAPPVGARPPVDLAGLTPPSGPPVGAPGTGGDLGRYPPPSGSPVPGKPPPGAGS